MAEFHDSTMSDERVTFNEDGNNGLILSGIYVPAELLAVILCYTDYKTLLNCTLVCKQWKMLIQSYIWRKKTEMMLGKSFPRNKDIPWDSFCLMYKKKPFERNLLKNHSGEDGMKYWEILTQGGDRWKVENPPLGVPHLPSTEPMFQEKHTCFVTSYNCCSKIQDINLVAEGLTPYVLDVLQPPIMVSEWYSCRWDCPAVYECQVNLLRNFEKYPPNIIDTFRFRDNLEGEKQYQWLHISHVFTNYGPGLRRISFYHGGTDKAYWAGHYGSKMAGACICVKVP